MFFSYVFGTFDEIGMMIDDFNVENKKISSRSYDLFNKITQLMKIFINSLLFSYENGYLFKI